ncbi:MAG: hypothetical protein Q9185_005427 [Variospora sp. 1 TL-2023]
MAFELHQSQPSQPSSVDSTATRDDGHGPISYQDSPPRSHSEQLRESTPTTSLSNHSSQQRMGSLSPLHIDGLAQSGLHRRSSNIASFPVEDSALQHTRICTASPYSSPPKRTATGQVKWASQGHPSSPNGATQFGHSRHTSTASKASQISDLSHELRTRLSYAMLKVQNGWQSHNLNELEAMALPQTSPTSGIIQIRHAATSSPPRDTAHLQHLQGSPARPSHHRPSLEPPLDFRSCNSRQPHPSNVQPPHLDTMNVSRNNNNGFLSPIGISTPPRRPSASTRTPSQKADMEKDAVETLMFMSSPVNSGCHPAALRAVATSSARDPSTQDSITSPTKRGGFASSGRDVTMSSPDPGRATGRLTTAAEIDRVLDEMRDQYSSSDED